MFRKSGQFVVLKDLAGNKGLYRILEDKDKQICGACDMITHDKLTGKSYCDLNQEDVHICVNETSMFQYFKFIRLCKIKQN